MSTWEYRCFECPDVKWWTNDREKVPCFVCGKEGIPSHQWREHQAARAIEDNT